MTSCLNRSLLKLDCNLPAEVVAQLDRFVSELLRWNQRRNLTAITDREEVIEKHLLDSMTLLPFAQKARRLLDLGSGAGFPALPLKIACPALKVVAVDAVGKKIDFQKHVVRTLRLTAYAAIHARAESLALDPEFDKSFDLVVARAVSSLGDVVRLAQPFVAPGGSLIAMKGPGGRQELARERDRLFDDGWAHSIHKLSLPDSGAERCLIELTRRTSLR